MDHKLENVPFLKWWCSTSMLVCPRVVLILRIGPGSCATMSIKHKQILHIVDQTRKYNFLKEKKNDESIHHKDTFLHPTVSNIKYSQIDMLSSLPVFFALPCPPLLSRPYCQDITNWCAPLATTSHDIPWVPSLMNQAPILRSHSLG